MVRRILYASAVIVLLSVVAAAQMGGYQDVLIVQVKPGQRAEFDAAVKKMVEANRRNRGDQWTTSVVTYGAGNTVYFVSGRQSYGEIETAFKAFYGALTKAYGQAGADKIEKDFDAAVLSQRSEFRRRRWDLSANPPADVTAYQKRVGESRWVRTTIVHVRPGQAPTFEAALKDLKAALEKANPPIANFVSQAEAGQHGTVFYVSRLVKSLAEFDGATPTSQLMGEEGYQKFLKALADSVETSEAIINQFLPELSNPPDGIASAAPDFWKPKPAAKPTAAEPAKPQAQ